MLPRTLKSHLLEGLPGEQETVEGLDAHGGVAAFFSQRDLVGPPSLTALLGEVTGEGGGSS